MKNVMKAVKKIKLWSRKRRKKKNPEPYYPPPPCHRCCSCSSSTEPSAPPLPSWLEPEQNYGTVFAPSIDPIPEVAYPSQAQVPPQESMIDPNPPSQNGPVRRSSSYQQYMAPEPVYGIPVTQTAGRERSRGIFGCVFSIGAHLFRCLFPCFHIRDVVRSGYA